MAPRNPAHDPRKARPGEAGRAERGTYRVRVDRNRGECVAACSFGVFDGPRIDDARLSRIGKLQSRAHVRRTPRADACQACGLCVVACPERAIALVLALTRR